MSLEIPLRTWSVASLRSPPVVEMLPRLAMSSWRAMDEYQLHVLGFGTGSGINYMWLWPQSAGKSAPLDPWRSSDLERSCRKLGVRREQ